MDFFTTVFMNFSPLLFFCRTPTIADRHCHTYIYHCVIRNNGCLADVNGTIETAQPKTAKDSKTGDDFARYARENASHVSSFSNSLFSLFFLSQQIIFLALWGRPRTCGIIHRIMHLCNTSAVITGDKLSS